jgi:hypothetical protein
VAIIFVPDDHATISLAIAAASDGDEIQVKSGDYPESVLIDSLTGITITGVDMGTGYPKISPAAKTHPAYDCASVIVRNSGHITLNNLVMNNAVVGETNYGVLVRASSDIVIQNVETTLLKSGIILQAEGVNTCQRVVINNCNVHDLTYAILSEGIGIDDQAATESDITITNNIFANLQYGIGMNPRDAVGVVGKYVITGNVFDTVSQIGLAVECNEGGGTNTATVLAYHNNFIDNLVANMHFSETTVKSILNTASPQNYCWKTIARLGVVGNYYSTHVGVDVNDDGIFDNTEIVSAHHIDNSPLFHEWGTEYSNCQRIHGYVYNASETKSDNVPVPMAGVSVTATDSATGVTQTAITNASGYYYFASPPIGESILLSADVNGFIITQTKKAVELISNHSVDFYLWSVRKYAM